LTSNLLFIVLAVIFAAIAAGLVVYGALQSKREPRTETKPIPAAVAKLRRTETKTQNPDYFCPKCYANIPEGLEFCSECGAKQE